MFTGLFQEEYFIFGLEVARKFISAPAEFFVVVV